MGKSEIDSTSYVKIVEIHIRFNRDYRENSHKIIIFKELLCDSITFFTQDCLTIGGKYVPLGVPHWSFKF